MLTIIKKILPAPLATHVRKVWHPLAALWGTLATGHPARRMVVVGVNGTKGKSTTADMLFAILSAAGHKTALASTIRFAIGDDSVPNKFKMTMPGRGYLQRFLARAIKNGATHAIIELTSEGAREWRHRFLSLNALIMLNVQREHIESFGSFEKYVGAKRWLVRELERSQKRPRVIIVCTDDTHNASFADARVEHVVTFSRNDVANLKLNDDHLTFVYKGVNFIVPLPGVFNAVNALAAIHAAEAVGVSLEDASRGLASMPQVKGRLEPIDAGQDFKVIIDYAHTPDSLEALYGAFPYKRKICVLGNTGGGRDAWKRPQMAAIAEKYCAEVILTNEDPYDEDPEKIVYEMKAGMKKEPTIIMNRREAIRAAFKKASTQDVVLISGKGTDPYIMGPNGSKESWSDAVVAREELDALLKAV